MFQFPVYNRRMSASIDPMNMFYSPLKKKKIKDTWKKGSGRPLSLSTCPECGGKKRNHKEWKIKKPKPKHTAVSPSSLRWTRQERRPRGRCKPAGAEGAREGKIQSRKVTAAQLSACVHTSLGSAFTGAAEGIPHANPDSSIISMT